MVGPEPGSGRAHLGVAVAEAAAAAGGVVGLKVKGPWAASEMEAGHAHGPGEGLGSGIPAGLMQVQNPWGYVNQLFSGFTEDFKF